MLIDVKDKNNMDEEFICPHPYCLAVLYLLDNEYRVPTRFYSLDIT